jgi:hypothetical protein
MTFIVVKRDNGFVHGFTHRAGDFPYGFLVKHLTSPSETGP